jgi:Family of unknown function (DUF5758)/Pentapeptide repeats (8 copies)
MEATTMDLQNTYGTIIFSAAVSTIKDLLLAAVRGGANLYGADLYGADLSGTNLYGANLYGADLSGTNLSRANLYGANLYGANLYGANLSRANLYGANLYGADLSGANLYGADLYGADLSGTNLSGAKEIPTLAAAQSNILPEGVIIGWKKCQNNVIVKLLIPAKARRSNATGRKCRAEFVRVSEVFGATEGISQYNPNVIYRKGATIIAHEWNEDRWVECGGGIHFYLSRIEAENN